MLAIRGRAGRLARVAAALVAATALLLPAAAPAFAAGVTFGQAEAEVTYGEGITFTIPITVSGPLERVEIRLRYPGSLGPFIEEIAVPAAGPQTLTYRLDATGSGHVVPNTPIVVTWAVLPAGADAPVLSEPQTVLYADTDHDWQSLQGDLVTVHWYAGTEAFARKALKIGDEAVRQTADLLGVTETEPVDFFIYGDQAAFRTALGPGTRENVGGQAHADIRTLFALISPGAIDDSWVGIVIPHELVHLVFDTAVSNPYRFPPRWVNEGLAVYLSESYGPVDRNLVADAAASRELLPLTALTGQFPTEPDKTYLAYAESVSAIDHLVRSSSQDALLTLITSYKDGLTDDEAFDRALGMDVAGFQAGWLEELGADVPQPYGPVANPPGPVPPGWGEATAPPPAAPRGDLGPVFAAIGGVVLVVLVAMVLARRRTALQ